MKNLVKPKLPWFVHGSYQVEVVWEIVLSTDSVSICSRKHVCTCSVSMKPFSVFTCHKNMHMSFTKNVKLNIKN